MVLRVFSYNMHKSKAFVKRQYVFQKIYQELRKLNPDLVFLQELNGLHPEFHNSDMTHSPLEELADGLWPFYAYGQNSVYQKGHHGNGLMCKYPLKNWENIDISTNRFERRGILHGALQLPKKHKMLHIFCLHLNLTEVGRQKQITRLIDRILEHVHEDEPLIIAGDFNDWSWNISDRLRESLKVEEAFFSFQGMYARSFPSLFPFLHLDRIYTRGCDIREAQVFKGAPWDEMSDHLPLWAELVF